MDYNQFKSPDSIYRPAPFWSWNDKLDKEELKRQIREMSDKGWGGYFMHSRVGLVTGYLSEEWMEMVKACAEEAKATNTYAWLYDEDKWPSGFAGGEVSKHKKYRSRALVLLKKEQITDNDTVLTTHVANNIKYFICKRISPLGDLWFNGTSYVDLMNPETVDTFIELTHEKYKESCGQYFSKEIPGIFTDEPCYCRARTYKMPAVPWSDYLAGYFQKLKGYDLKKHLPSLFFDLDNYRKIRFDFYDSATRLFLDSFTKKYYNWCNENDLIMTGHYMAEDTLISQLQWIGAAMPHYEFMHWPGIDKLGRHLEQIVTVKQVTSVADQLDKERSFCEVFGCIGQHASFFHRKWIADWQAALGISFVNHHLSLYSMRGERKRDFPANLYYQQPWWENEKEFGDYIGRLSYAVSEGKRNVDILIIHPVASVWSEYSPLHEENNMMVEKELYDNPFADLSRKMLEAKLDFHYGDEMIMENHARVEDGKLIIGKQSYSKVIIPPSLTLQENTLNLIKEFASSAGENSVIAINQPPERINGVKTPIEWPDEMVQVNNVSSAIDILNQDFKDRINVINQFTGENAPEIFYHERLSENGRTILLVNTAEKKEIVTNISIPEKNDVEPLVMDLSSGDNFKIPVKNSKNRVNLQVKFYPAGSLLLYFPENEDDLKIQQPRNYFDSGVQLLDNSKQKSNGNNDIYNIKNIIKKTDDFQVNILEDNVLPLKNVTLYMDNKLVLENQPINKAWHDHFYQAANGTPFKAEYSFEIKNVPEDEITAVIEVAQNLDNITINGKKVEPLKKDNEPLLLEEEKNWKDISFTRVPLSENLKNGTNKLVIEGKKENNITGPNCHVAVDDFKNHKPTEVETVYLIGDFSVCHENKTNFYIDGNKSDPKASNLTTSGYPFYAGKVEFTCKLTLDNIPDTNSDQIYININDVNTACLDLYINGEQAGTKYWEPYIYEITDLIKVGENEIKIIAATTLFNLMGPNRIESILEDDFVGPRTFVDFNRFTEKYTLLPFGIGSVSLVKN